MNITWSAYLGKSPIVYSSKVIREIGLKQPPFCERTIADHLGLDVVEFTYEQIGAFKRQNPNNSEILEHLQTACAWLHRENGHAAIFTNAMMSPERKRLAVGHECGHALMPWHQDIDYLYDDEIQPTTMSRIEREAFMCGSALLMPPKHFVEDMMSLEPSLASINQLADRYVMSFEATAIWYASTYPGYCGLLVAEPTTPVPHRAVAGNSDQTTLAFDVRTTSTTSAGSHELRVKYFVRSNSFPLFVRAGTAIANGSPIHDAFLTAAPVKSEVLASALGSSEKDRLQIDCCTLGFSRVFALVWVQDPRSGFRFTREVYA